MTQTQEGTPAQTIGAGCSLTGHVAEVLKEHRMRFGGGTNSRIIRVCSCGGWRSDRAATFDDHMADVTCTAAGDYITTDLAKMLRQKSADSPATAANKAGMENTVKRVADLFAGCTCRPGSMLGRWGCDVEGHDESWEE